MSMLKHTRDAFVADLTRTRHMWAVSAVILGATFMPLVGGLPQAHEIAEIRSVLSEAEPEHAAPDSAAERRQSPRAERSAARVQTAAMTENEAELTTLALITEVEPEPAFLGSEEGMAPVAAFEDEPAAAPDHGLKSPTDEDREMSEGAFAPNA